MRRPLLLLLLAAACAEPFPVDRHDLGPFRIAAIGVIEGEARAAIWAGQPFHEKPVQLEWSLDGEPLGQGWGVEVPGEGELSLVATAPDGTVRQARVSVAEAAPDFEVERQAVDLGKAIAIEERRDKAAIPLEGETVPEGLAARLEVEAAEQIRWMTAKGQGSLLEVGPTETDFLAEELVFDGGELESRRALDPFMATLLVLSIDGEGGNRWRWMNLPMGIEGSWVRQGELLLDLQAEVGRVAATIEGIDAEAGKIEWVKVEAVEDLSQQEDLDCIPEGQSFRVEWLHEGRCTSEELLGARVVMEVGP